MAAATRSKETRSSCLILKFPKVQTTSEAVLCPARLVLLEAEQLLRFSLIKLRPCKPLEWRYLNINNILNRRH